MGDDLSFSPPSPVIIVQEHKKGGKGHKKKEKTVDVARVFLIDNVFVKLPVNPGWSNASPEARHLYEKASLVELSKGKLKAIANGETLLLTKSAAAESLVPAGKPSAGIMLKLGYWLDSPIIPQNRCGRWAPSLYASGPLR